MKDKPKQLVGSGGGAGHIDKNTGKEIMYLQSPSQPKIIQISASDNRMTALGDNGKAYWFKSTLYTTDNSYVEEWVEYPPLPINNKKK
jgi:hypothetical protein